jgi:hypothetical protein
LVDQAKIENFKVMGQHIGAVGGWLKPGSRFLQFIRNK